jgi:hypothetical protein
LKIFAERNDSFSINLGRYQLGKRAIAGVGKLSASEQKKNEFRAFKNIWKICVIFCFLLSLTNRK